MHRYAIFSAHFDPHMGGIESFTKNLAGELAAEGHDVMVVTSQLGDDPAHEVREEGYEVVRLPAHLLMGGRLPISKRNAEYERNLDHVREWAPDRILVNARFYEHSVEALKLARELGAPAVMLDHGSAYLSLSQPMADAALKVQEHVMTARDKRLGPVFAGISQKSAQWLRTFGIWTDLVVNNAIDAEAFRAASSRRDFRAELGIGSDAFLAAQVGRLIPEKHPELLAAAARALPKAAFVVAGDGPEAAAVEAAAREVPNLHLVGRLERADVSALLCQSDALLQPTRSEGMPTTMLEAGAWGVTSVIPDVGGVEDAFGGTELVSLLPNLEEASVVHAVAALAAQPPEDRGARRDAVRRHVEQACTWQRTAAQLDAAFQVAEAGAGSVRP